MDTKKLFDYEFQIESLKPHISDSELLLTTKNPDSIHADDMDKIASFSVVQGVEGLYIKFADESGNHKKLSFLNPLLAKSLASTLLHGLSAQGYIEDDILEEAAPETQSIH